MNEIGPRYACPDCGCPSSGELDCGELLHALNKPLRETILAVLTTMPPEVAPEHLAAMIEDQVRAWQKIP